MGTIKQTARRLKGKTKQAVAEVLGDGKLQEEGRTEQCRAEEQDDSGKSGVQSPLRNLNQLT
jgi:uncharacterized protein YjbJ (UPF0337 family)